MRRHTLALGAVWLLLQTLVPRVAPNPGCTELVPGCCSPNLIIIGTMKCGTNAMMAYLAHHPAFVDTWTAVEVHYLTEAFVNEQDFASAEGLDDYASRLVCVGPDEPGWVVDKSPSYLNIPELAWHAKQLAPNAKIISVMCDPAERFWKEWWHNLRYNENDRCQEVTKDLSTARASFQEDLLQRIEDYEDKTSDPLAHGRYGDHIQSWIEAYGHENVMAVDSDMLRTHRLETTSKVLNFLGLDPNELEVSGDDQLGDVYHSNHPDLHHSAWIRLKDFYELDSLRLAETIGEEWPKEWALNSPLVTDMELQHQLLRSACERPEDGLGLVIRRGSLHRSHVAARLSELEHDEIPDVTGLSVREMKMQGLIPGQVVRKCDTESHCKRFTIKDTGSI